MRRYLSMARRHVATTALIVITLMMLQSAVLAQMTGTITGTVYDSSGAVVPQSKVTIKNQANGTTRQTVSNAEGFFSFNAVTSGTYVLQAEAVGFKKWESRTINLRPGDKYDLTTIALVVGASGEEVTVEARQEEVRVVDSGERSFTLDPKALSSMPIVGRNATDAIRALPGFAIYTRDNQINNKPGYAGEVVGFNGPAGAYSANGTGVDAVGIMSDGASIIDPGCNCSATQNVNVDMVSELKVQTSNYSADSAKGPVVINAIGKSGSSAYHGHASVQARNYALNSNDWLNNHLNVARPTDRYWYPGFGFGGPIRIPGTGLNKKNDKLFFYVGYEYYHQQFPGPLLQTWVPTEKMRAGDFSSASLADMGCVPGGPNAGKIFCQVPTHEADGTPLVNGDVSGIMTSGGQAIMKMFPLPNANPLTTAGGYNYVNQLMQTQNGHQTHARLDYNVSENHKLFFTYNRQTQNTQEPVNLYWVPVGSVPYPGDAQAQDNSNTFSVNYTAIISPTFTNEFVASIAYYNHPLALKNPDAVDRTKLGFDFGGIFDNGVKQMPAIVDWIQGGYPQLLMPGGFENGSIYSKKVVPNFANNLSKLFSTHLLKAGFYYEDATNNQTLPGPYSQGQMQFYPWTYQYGSLGALNGWAGCNGNNPVCFNPVAQILMGLPDSYTEANYVPITNMAYRTIAFYATDSWKANRRLTVDLGVRFEHLAPWRDKRGTGMAVWDADRYADEVGTSVLPGMVWNAIDGSLPNSGIEVPALFVSPRVGFAWDVKGTGNTIVRGGIGAYRYHESYNDYAGALSTAIGAKTMTRTGQMTFDDIDSTTFVGGMTPDINVTALDANDDKQPVTYNYNLTISQRMPFKSLLEIGYVGNRTRNQLLYDKLTDINLIPVGTLFDITLPEGCNDAGCQAVNTHFLDQLRPYSYYNQLRLVRHGAYSNYNALQVTWNRTSGSILYGVNYTFSKALTIGGGSGGNITNPFNLEDNYIPAAYDRTHIFNATYTIDLPKLAGTNKVLRGIANGWTVSGLTSLQSGPPLASMGGVGANFGLGGTVAVPAGQSGNLDSKIWLGTPDVSVFPIVTCDPTSGLNGAQKQYVNQGCFAVPTRGTNGSYRMPYIHGPAYFSSDLSVFKNFALGEKRNLQFRLTATNFLNHPLTSFNKDNNANVQYKVTNKDVAIPTSGMAYALQNTGFGYADIKYGRRTVQLGAKFEF